MTVDELQAELVRRRARLMVDFAADGTATVFLTHVKERGKAGKSVTAEEATLTDALAVAFLRYDGSWKP